MAPKKKQEKMALGDFLNDQSLGSWADEMDSVPMPSASAGYSSRGGGGDEKRGFGASSWDRSGSGMGGSGGGFGDRPEYARREALPLPDKPPYTAHLGNLAFDVTQPDVEKFLEGCNVTSVRIVEDKMDHKPKGFGYVEFGTVDGLKKALTLSDSSFMGRNIRISVAEPSKDRQESNRDFSDWSRKGPLPDLPSQGRQPSRGFSRGGFENRGNFDNMSDAGSERGGSRRPGYFQDDGKVRDFGDWSRKGPLSPAPGAGPPARDGGRLREGGPPMERRASPAWGEGRSEAGSRPPRREFQDRAPVERAPTAADQDSQWRSKMRPDPSPAATPDVSTPSSPIAQAPKERPRLNLAKRTVSTAEPDSASGSDSKASPFGAARPIDTATREREIDEKRQVAVREKQEADAKAREESKAKEAAARQERGDRADRGQAQQDNKATSPTGEFAPSRRTSRPQNGPKAGAKQNGEEAPQRERPSFSILNRDTEGGDEDGAGDMPDANANGEIVGDKDTKPQEIVKEIPRDAGQGAAQNADTTADAMEDDGWSTVAAKPKANRRGGSRAMAS